MKPGSSKDPKAQFLEVYETYADALFRHCYFKLSDREHATDIAAETFARTWEHVARGDEIDNMRAFLYRVANNLIIDRYRKKKSSSLDSLMDEGFDVPGAGSERLIDTLDGRKAIELVKTLDEKYRDVIILRYVDDLSPREIAETLGLTENAVSVRIHRGIKQLRDLYNAKELNN